jgi:phosphoadenosine phosphosulfate reductase
VKITQLLPQVRAEVERPFQEKLARARQLIKLYAHRNACVSCSFGKDSTVVLYLVRDLNPQIPVIFNNTGVEFQETLEFKEQLKREWNLNLIELKPEKSFWQIMDPKQVKIPDGSKTAKPYYYSKHTHDRCCYYLKEKPFKDYVKGRFNFNFTGITAMESRQRMLRACEKGMEYYHKTHGLLKVHPILYWTPDEVWRFIEENSIPVNPAYQKYKIDRIGCVPCTSHKEWREQLAKVNPKMYQFIQERFFGQKLLQQEAKP